MALTPITATWGELAVGETALGTKGVLAEVALGAPGRFAAFDALVTLTVRAADRDERHGPFLPKRDYEDKAQCDSNRSQSPLLKHYHELHDHEIRIPKQAMAETKPGMCDGRRHGLRRP